MRRFAVAAAASVVLPMAAAQAADLQVKVPPPVGASAFSWNSVYIGGHVGAGLSDADFGSVTDVLFPGFLVGPPLILIPDRFGTIPGVTASDDKFLGGAQVGINAQAGSFVFGLEADISGADLNGSVAFPVAPAFGFAAGQTLTGTYSTEINWMASLRARLGFAWDRLLIYATGGGALIDADVTSSFTLVNSAPNILVPIPGASGTTARTSSMGGLGWTIGGGLAFALTDAWSIGAEYRHSDFGSHQIALATTDPSGILALPALATSVNLTVDQATVRLNYRLVGP